MWIGAMMLDENSLNLQPSIMRNPRKSAITTKHPCD